MTAIITEDLVESLCSEAKTLTEFERRQFQAEMATKYCGGGQLGDRKRSRSGVTAVSVRV